MSVVFKAPDRDLVWRTKVSNYGGSANRPLDGLPAPVAAAVANAPKIYDRATSSFVQQNLSLAMQFASPRTMKRNDALGLGPDPALTIAWKMRATDPIVGSAPNLLALGDATIPELCLYFGPTDTVSLGNFDATLGATWWLALGTLIGLHSYILTKPAGTGYDGTAWALYLDGVAIPLHDTIAGPLSLGSQLTQLSDVPGGGFEFDGSLTGMLVWDSVLSVDALAQLQAFLDSV